MSVYHPHMERERVREKRSVKMKNVNGTKCVHCGEDDDGNIQTYNKGCNQIKLFGVQIGVNGGAAAESSSFRKSKSMGNIEAFISENATAEEEEEPSGYLSDGSAHEYSKSHERKRGKPWSEAEHRSFLEGLEKLGKGDWKGIATKFVRTRKSSQVASHAQKYFNRLNLIAANAKRRRGSVFDIPLTHNANQPTQGSKSNNADESLHIATTSAAASKNIGEIKVLPSMNMQAHDTTSERPPLSPKKRDFHGVFYQPRISWVPFVEHVPIQNGTGFVGNAQQHYATVMPQPSVDAVRQGWHPVLLTTTNDELNPINAYGYRQGWYRAPSNTNSNELNLNVRNLAL